MTEILDESAVSEIEAQLTSGSLLLPLRVEGWHKSLTDGGWFIKNALGRILMTVAFVPVEIETGKPALDGNAPARHTAALLNSIPALCATVKYLRAENERLAAEVQALAEQLIKSADRSGELLVANGELRSRVVHLCKQKAEEWTGESSFAAEELATELEKL